MKGRRPSSDNVVPLTGEGQGANFEVRAAQIAKELRPADLPDEVRWIWDRIAPPLCDPRKNRLNETNVYMFEMLCWTIARYERLRLDVWEGNETYASQTRNGVQLKSRPEVGQLNETWRQVRALSADFGMTPAAERGLAASGQLGFQFSDGDDFD